MEVSNEDIDVLQGYGVHKLLVLWQGLREPALGQLVDTTKLPEGCPGQTLNAGLQQAIRLVRQTVKEVLIEKLEKDEQEATPTPVQPDPATTTERPVFTPPFDRPESPPSIPPSVLPGEVTDPSLR